MSQANGGTAYQLVVDTIRRTSFTEEEWHAADPWEPVGEILYVECRLFDGRGQCIGHSAGKTSGEALQWLARERGLGSHPEALRWLAEIAAQQMAGEKP